MNKGKIFGGILLVSGTAIGAGMLALPISTAHNGFIPTTVAFLICWFFMTLAALLLLEINLRIPGERDFVSMVGLTLGFPGKCIAWTAYLLLLYALICAYLTGGSAWMIAVFAKFNMVLSPIISLAILVVIFGLIISYGTGLTEYINRYLALGLVIAYCILVFTALPSVNMQKISHVNFDNLPITFPLMITAFGFSVVLPSLTNYLDRNTKVLTWVVIIGGILPLTIYLLWEWVAVGIIPLTGAESFQTLATHHDNGTGVAAALEHIVKNPWITQSSRWFAILAVFTSLLGISLALFHFLADGLSNFHLNAKKASHRLLLLFLTYSVPFVMVLFYPIGFSRILGWAGLFVAVLLGVLPAVMVWIGRSAKTAKNSKAEARSAEEYRVWGGKPMLISVMIFFTYITYLEITNCLVCASR